MSQNKDQKEPDNTEPKPPKVANQPSQKSAPSKVFSPETERFGMNLLQLVFQNDREEISRLARDYPT